MIAVPRNEAIEILKVLAVQRAGPNSAVMVFDRAVTDEEIEIVFHTLQELVESVEKQLSYLESLDTVGNA